MTDGDAPDEKFPSKFESALKTKPATGTPVPQTAHGFYLYTASSASLTLSSSNVFYWVASEQVANTLCRLCSKQYSSEGEEPVFLSKSAADVEPDEQVLLDEALDWLAVYCADPDPSVYDPAPPEGVMMRAEYAKRSGDWEFAIAERRGGESSGAIEKGPNQTPHLETPDLTLDKLQMSVEDRRNLGLNLLLLLAQAYYKILECVISTASLCCALDLELNESYLWTITSLKNLLANHEDLRDFPAKFEPIFPDLYPSTVRDVDWDDMVAPAVEQFLSTVHSYVLSCGIDPPEKGSSAWVFIEMFRPAVERAVERAVVYKRRILEYARKTFGDANPPGQTQASVAGTPRKRSGRPPRMAPDFVDFAGCLWRNASRQNPGSRSESKARSKVPDEALAAIASSLDSKGYVPPANYLEKHFAIQVKNYNSRNSNSKTGPIQTWSQLISVADQEHLRGMRKLLSRCAEKLKSRGPRLSGK